MLSSRKEDRQALATILATITDFAAVYDHETKNFGGMSPVAMIHSDGTDPTVGRMYRSHSFIISLWVKRTDAQDTEDGLDDLSQTVLDMLEGRTTPLEMSVGLLGGPSGSFSAQDYPVVDGVQYRREMIRVVT